ncbi:hypothetical protein SSP531S_44630 [Streptomyces spongiicola]|uniref:Uncharacterized protein n=1 Tax=Streptomyces spongiicola TaxID=1690221 RepID=A0A388T224_9ACTN|nr:hypothetical protein SSP531S_44630 [Streptomyces spongiicola]
MKSEDSVVLPLPPFPTKAIFMFSKVAVRWLAVPEDGEEDHSDAGRAVGARSLPAYEYEPL